MKMTCLTQGADDIPTLFRPFALKMEEQGIPPIVINVFKCYFTQLAYGAQGKLTESEIEPVDEEDVSRFEDLARYADAGRAALRNTVIVKLNGGLGTSMGLDRAKSLIPVKEGRNFLDIIIGQTRKLREKHQINLPLVFMNSFKTHRDTMLKAEGFDNRGTDIPMAFVQHRYPKILESDLTPADWPDNPELEWNPPGHGDLYTALVTSELLQKLLAKGYHYAFVSNSDNLGAIMDERILGYMAEERLHFVMEVARRTAMDKKGGHLTKLKKSGRLKLRELAQCPDPELDRFQDIERHRFFNTNSIWLDLREVEKVFIENFMVPLDLIVNPKTLDPRDPDSPRVIQLETAMGSAISSFERAQAVVVPRGRFAPVKTTSDLLVVMSDCYVRDQEERILPCPECAGRMPVVHLDGAYYKKIDQFLDRFPEGAPSLIRCDRLEVHGDVRFEAGVTVTGSVKITNKGRKQAVIEKGATISQDVTFT